jgi:hypothetical protein
MTQMMALKFYKSLFSIAEKDKEIIGDMIEVDPILACQRILDQLVKRLKNPNMLHSACLEFINSYGVFVMKQLGSEFHESVVARYGTILSGIPTTMLDKFFVPVKPVAPRQLKGGKQMNLGLS